MIQHQLAAQPRTLLGKHSKKLRRTGLIPASVFGKNLPSQNIQISVAHFAHLKKQVGESTLIYLEINGEKQPRPVLISQISYHPVSQQILHVSFHQVNLKEKVTAPVPVVLVGESPAEKDKLGILVQPLDKVEIEALPANMPENIQLDISHLSQVGDHLTVKDIPVSPKLTIKDDPQTIIAQISPLAKEEVVEKPAAETALAAPAEAEAPVSTEEPQSSATPP